MSPNPYILLRNLVTPQRWFRSNEKPKTGRRIEYWDEPARGAYEFIPGRGWFLIATYADHGQTLDKLETSVPIIYCRILDRNMFKADYESRKKQGHAKDEHDRDITGTFYLLDDSHTFIYRWDQEGKATRCDKMQPYVVDAVTGEFRIKRRGDCTVVGQEASDSIDGEATKSKVVASPSARSFVNGNAHRPSLSSTVPSTRSATRPSSSHGSSAAQARKASTSTATTPSISKTYSSTALNSVELERRLKDLKMS